MAGSDASIYSMIRPQTPSQGPMEGMGQMLQIRHMMDQGQLGDLQRKQLERAMAEDDAVKAAFSGMRPGQTVKDILPGVMKVSPTKGLALQKQVTDQDKAAADLDKTKLESHGIQVKNLRDQLVAVSDDAGLAAVREGAMKLYGFKAAQGFPQSVNDPNFRAWQEKNIMDATAFLKRVEPMYETVNLGGTSRVIQKNPNAAGATVGDMQRTLTPDAILTDERARSEGAANRGVTVRGQDLVNARAAEAAGIDKFGDPKEVTGPNGRPMLVMQNKRTGEMVDANTKQPVGGVGPKLGETSQKQLAGVQTTKDAIAEYSSALKNWSATDIVRPDARAKMGTIYNNMMLQAKEAYNLGVLNGPDYMILQEVITSPASLKGGITSNEALGAQAAKLDEIMGKIGQQVTATQSGVTPPAAAKPSKAPALGAREGGYIFKGGDPSNPKSWEKERK